MTMIMMRFLVLISENVFLLKLRSTGPCTRLISW
jgi:hypothetical protein